MQKDGRIPVSSETYKALHAGKDLWVAMLERFERGQSVRLSPEGYEVLVRGHRLSDTMDYFEREALPILKLMNALPRGEG